MGWNLRKEVVSMTEALEGRQCRQVEPSHGVPSLVRAPDSAGGLQAPPFFPGHHEMPPLVHTTMLRALPGSLRRNPETVAPHNSPAHSLFEEVWARGG